MLARKTSDFQELVDRKKERKVSEFAKASQKRISEQTKLKITNALEKNNLMYDSPNESKSEGTNRADGEGL